MKECEALAKHLSFMISLNSQSLAGVERPEADLEFAQNLVVHQLAPLIGLQVDIAYSDEARISPTLADATIS